MASKIDEVQLRALQNLLPSRTTHSEVVAPPGFLNQRAPKVEGGMQMQMQMQQFMQSMMQCMMQGGRIPTGACNIQYMGGSVTDSNQGLVLGKNMRSVEAPHRKAPTLMLDNGPVSDAATMTVSARASESQDLGSPEKSELVLARWPSPILIIKYTHVSCSSFSSSPSSSLSLLSVLFLFPLSSLSLLSVLSLLSLSLSFLSHFFPSRLFLHAVTHSAREKGKRFYISIYI